MNLGTQHRTEEFIIALSNYLVVWGVQITYTNQIFSFRHLIMGSIFYLVLPLTASIFSETTLLCARFLTNLLIRI